MKKWITESQDELYKGRIFSLYDNRCYHPVKRVEHNFYVLKTYDWINVVALTEANEIILVKQHRLGTDELTLETPGGIIEKNETPEDTALRELEEETGYKSEKIILLKKLSANPAILNNYIYFYLALGCKQLSHQILDSAEDIEIQVCSMAELKAMINSGAIDHSIVITALSLYFLSDFCNERIVIV